MPLGCLLVRVAGHEESHIIHKRLGFSNKSICIRLTGVARQHGLPAHFLHALLACHRLAGALASTSVSAGALTADRQASTMAEASEAGDVTQTCDILLDFTAKEAFYLEIVFEHLGDSGEFIITQLACFTLGIDIESLTNLNAGGRPNAVQIAQRDVRGLIWRNVDTHNTGHANSPLTLSLLVARVCADHIYFAMSPYDLALIANTANT